MLCFPVVIYSFLIAHIIFLILDWTGIIDKLEFVDIQKDIGAFIQFNLAKNLVVAGAVI